MIDFDAMARASTAMNTNLKRFMAKWSCNCLATGKNMVRWKMRHEGYCPFCTETNETTAHILTCKHEDALNGWNKEWSQFINKLQRLDTCWNLMHAIRIEVHNWRYGLPQSPLDEYPLLLQQAIQEQRQLGWNLFFEGIISQKWAHYMTTYYEAIGNFKSGNNWAQKLVHLTWKTTFAIWETRNKQLHETQRIHDMEGVPILQKAITVEWNQGIGRLTASEYSALFQTTPIEIFQKSIDTQKQWLMTIRQGRILLDPERLQEDEFTNSTTLQKWIGLSYDMTDEEATPILREAIINEWRIGLGNLPSHLFDKFFNTTLTQLMNQPLSKQKKWFQRVRQGRICMDPTNLLDDEFTSSGPIHTWIDLTI